jgi:hypothetical protein
MFAKHYARPFATILLTLGTSAAYANGRLESHEKTLFNNGLRAPTYLDISAQITKEYNEKQSGLLNLQFGPQLWRANDNIVSIAVVARGVAHAHTQHKEMKLGLYGGAVEYIYSGYMVRPHGSIAYLTGQQVSDNPDNNENQDMVDISKIELQGLLGYYVRASDLEVVFGYNHAFNTKNTKLETLNAKKERVLTQVGNPDEKSQKGSFMLGLRLTSF